MKLKFPPILIKIVLVIIVFTLTFLIYFNTLTTDIGWSDSAELALQAFQLGVTHPPGYPIHSMLGYFLIIFFNEPYHATTFLSAFCTSLTSGVLCLTILELTKNPIISFLSPFIFAFIPNIWDTAVVTEIYNVNILFISISIYLIIQWKRCQKTILLLLSACLYGISLGTNLGNLLILPAFLFFIYLQRDKKVQNLTIYLLIIGAFGIPILSFSILRSSTSAPLGTQYLPTSFSGAIKYFTGYQYGTLSIRDRFFYYNRTIQHSQIILKNLLYVGFIFALLGGYNQFRKDRSISLFMLLMFLLNLGYFTYYPVRDYSVMVAPAYYFLTIWIAFGFDFLYQETSEYPLSLFRIGFVVCLLLFILYPLQSQYDKRLDRKDRNRAEIFSKESFEIFPPDAAILGNWSVVTTLLYFQKTQNLRSDLLIMECTSKPRTYAHGEIDNCLDYIENAFGSKPIIIEDRYLNLLSEKYSFIQLSKNWFVIDKKTQEG